MGASRDSQPSKRFPPSRSRRRQNTDHPSRKRRSVLAPGATGRKCSKLPSPREARTGLRPTSPHGGVPVVAGGCGRWGGRGIGAQHGAVQPGLGPREHGHPRQEGLGRSSITASRTWIWFGRPSWQGTVVRISRRPRLAKSEPYGSHISWSPAPGHARGSFCHGVAIPFTLPPFPAPTVSRLRGPHRGAGKRGKRKRKRRGMTTTITGARMKTERV